MTHTITHMHTSVSVSVSFFVSVSFSRARARTHTHTHTVLWLKVVVLGVFAPQGVLNDLPSGADVLNKLPSSTESNLQTSACPWYFRGDALPTKLL